MIKLRAKFGNLVWSYSTISWSHPIVWPKAWRMENLSNINSVNMELLYMAPHVIEFFMSNTRLASFPSSIWWFCSVIGKKTRFICYITLICCELNFFVLAGWAGTAKKICNYLGGNWRSHKTNCHCSEILFTFV